MSEESSKKSVGRPKSPPITFTDEQLQLAIELAAKGESLKVIVGELLTTEYRFWKYKQEHLRFFTQFEEARQEGLEHLADALIHMSDEYEDVQRARLKSDNHKWLLSKRKPGTYGDKLDVNVNQTIDIGPALEEAKRRSQLKNVTPDINLITHDIKRIEEDN